VDVRRVVLSVEPHFVPGRKQRVVALMPRKRPDAARYLELALASEMRSCGWRIDVIDRQSHEEVGRRLSEASVFVSLGRREGFGLPAAEAIQAGCYVVGFAGVAGHEFMLEPYAQPVPEDDYLALANSVRRAIALCDEQPLRFAELMASARSAVMSRYSHERERVSVLDAFSGLDLLGSEAVGS
jgi:glycosyltransferase involved in cell wall biosynthesis